MSSPPSSSKRKNGKDERDKFRYTYFVQANISAGSPHKKKHILKYKSGSNTSIDSQTNLTLTTKSKHINVINPTT